VSSTAEIVATGPTRPSFIREQMHELADAVETKPPRPRRREVVLADGPGSALSPCGEGASLVAVHGVMAEGMLYAAPSGASPGSASGSLPWTAPATAAPHRWASGKPRWHR
jgi:hypothetical protein